MNTLESDRHITALLDGQTPKPNQQSPSQPQPQTGQHGVYSEVGKLRRVLVCRPGLAQKRLTPANCKELLFDDVLWVAQARNDHDAFTSAMIERDTNELADRDGDFGDAAPVGALMLR